MHRQQRQTETRVEKTEEPSKRTAVQRSKGEVPPSRPELSVSETLKLYEGVIEVRVAGVFRASGERSAVAAVTTIIGFVALVLKHVPLEVCVLEGALGAWLVWMLTPKRNEKD